MPNFEEEEIGQQRLSSLISTQLANGCLDGDRRPREVDTFSQHSTLALCENHQEALENSSPSSSTSRINYTGQLSPTLVVYGDSFHTKMQFFPRVSVLPNGLHRISVMVSGYFPGDKLITMVMIRGSASIEEVKSTEPCKKHI